MHGLETIVALNQRGADNDKARREHLANNPSGKPVGNPAPSADPIRTALVKAASLLRTVSPATAVEACDAAFQEVMTALDAHDKAVFARSKVAQDKGGLLPPTPRGEPTL